MKIDTTLLITDLSQMPTLARTADELGFDGIWVSETAHDAFLPLVLAAEHSERVSLGTSIAVAFPRSPAILAYIAWDLAKYSRGRVVVGLGTQTNNYFQ
jgi:alkanesulfonate monooxygenase SsuD/methylene tetrahydromethanopterin reductase-like flavin-dependent oxidoreductase (luciferase family)